MTMFWRDPRTIFSGLNIEYAGLMRIARFTISGSLATSANLATVYALTHYFKIWYLYSSIAAFGTSFLISFVLQKIWTFQDTSKEAIHVQAALFLTIILAGLGINTVLVYSLVEFAGLHYILAQLASGLLIAVINFFSYKNIVFRKTTRS